MAKKSKKSSHHVVEWIALATVGGLLVAAVLGYQSGALNLPIPGNVS
jgi:hypothetical protein